MTSSNTSNGGRGFDLPTLAITAAASAGAAYVCSIVWAPGTLASAAFTPVLVALLKEALARPADVVTRAVPVRGVVRSATPADEPDTPVEPVIDRVAQHGEVAGRSRAPRRRGWRVAIATGLLGFLVAAVIITLPELVAGKAATGGGRETTLFSGGDEASEPRTTTTTAPPRTVTVPPAETVTVPAPAQTTTAPPATTTTPPPETQTTPAPTPETETEATPAPAPPPPPG